MYPTIPLPESQTRVEPQPTQIQLHPALRYDFMRALANLDKSQSRTDEGSFTHRCAAATTPTLSSMNIVVPSRALPLVVYPSTDRTVVTVGDVLSALSEAMVDVWGKHQGFKPYALTNSNGQRYKEPCACEGISILDHWRFRYRAPVGLCADELDGNVWILRVGEKVR